MTKVFELEEIGFDTTLETESSLIKIADFHCRSYDDRDRYLPIDTVEKAIDYFSENGFAVREKGCLVGVVETSELEKRIEALEKNLHIVVLIIAKQQSLLQRINDILDTITEKVLPKILACIMKKI